MQIHTKFLLHDNASFKRIAFFKNLVYIFFTYSLFIPFTAPSWPPPLTIFLPSHSTSPLNGWGLLGIPYSHKSNVCQAKLFLSHGGQTSQPSQENISTYRQQLLGQPTFQLFRTHMKTKLHISYLCMGRPRFSLFFGWCSDSASPNSPGQLTLLSFLWSFYPLRGL